MNFKKILAFSLALACVFPLSSNVIINDTSIVVSAEELDIFTDGDYDFTITNDEATLVKYNGSETEVTLPTTLTDENGTVYNVTTIGEACFMDNTDITSVVIPNTITKWNNSNNSGSFKDCLNLTTVTFESESKLENIGQNAFNGCESLTTIEIPSSVQSIGKSAFQRCVSLETITYNEEEEKSKLNTIDISAFSGCMLLKSVTIPKSVTNVSSSAFSGCVSLTDVTFEDSSLCTTIDNNAFYGCTNLVTINLPIRLTTLGANAFENCESLLDIEIPQTVTSVGESAFENCTTLKTLSFQDGNAATFGINVFSNCTSLSDVSFANSMITLGENMFVGCTSLVDVTLPSSLSQVPKAIFKDCTLLRSVTIQDGSTKLIGENAFENCISLTYAEVPKSVETVSQKAFYNCQKLEGISLLGVTSIQANAFNGCLKLGGVDFSDTLKTVNEKAFYNCVALKNVNLPETVKNIGDNAFGYSASDDGDVLLENFTIYGVVGSNVETYASENGINFLDVNENEPPSVVIPVKPTTDNNFVNGVFGDVNGDGFANVVDVLVLKKLILGILDR